jgi:hypothetical protein
MLRNSDIESSSSDASSVLDETALKLMVAEKISYDQLVFNRKVLPDGFFVGTLAPSAPKQSMMVIRVDASLLHNPSSKETRKACTEVFKSNGLDIVPWHPVVGSIALQVYAQQMDRLAEEAEMRTTLTCVNPESIEAVHTLGPSTESSPVAPVAMETEENT